MDDISKLFSNSLKTIIDKKCMENFIKDSSTKNVDRLDPSLGIFVRYTISGVTIVLLNFCKSIFISSKTEAILYSMMSSKKMNDIYNLSNNPDYTLDEDMKKVHDQLFYLYQLFAGIQAFSSNKNTIAKNFTGLLNTGLSDFRNWAKKELDLDIGIVKYSDLYNINYLML